ncbi:MULTISPECIES: YARHG domain-containing protein [Clostridium]|uniref:YARHG domain-containing protein n=1 Tax=Clostridium nitritogenes TaxID=83340 RepID=A0ABN1LMW1_9CLOT|nr:YARHG domain-containing protein [Clostridium baratii]STA99822.1 Predicted membrane protein [Clostridium baratii]
MKFCRKCGAEITPGDKFCGKCGAPLEDNNIPTNDTTLNDNAFNNVNNSTSINNDSSKPLGSENNHPPIEDFKYHKGKKKGIIIGSIAFIIIIVACILFLERNNLLYSYYYNKANNATTITSKLANYNNALEHSYTNEVINDIFNTLKDDKDFKNDINSVYNLSDKDKKDLISRIAIYAAENAYNSGEYENALNYLNTANDNGADISKLSIYDKLKEKINSSNYDDFTNYYNNSNDNTSSTINSSDFEKAFDSANGYLAPDSDSAYLTENELKGFSKNDLALMRNEIYARHGYIFHTEPFVSYFNSKSWYTKNPSFKGDNKELNKYELYNVNLLKKLEDSK